jgi:hypothetical protein
VELQPAGDYRRGAGVAELNTRAGSVPLTARPTAHNPYLDKSVFRRVDARQPARTARVYACGPATSARPELSAVCESIVRCDMRPDYPGQATVAAERVVVSNLGVFASNVYCLAPVGRRIIRIRRCLSRCRLKCPRKAPNVARFAGGMRYFDITLRPCADTTSAYGYRDGSCVAHDLWCRYTGPCQPSSARASSTRCGTTT